MAKKKGNPTVLGVKEGPAAEPTGVVQLRVKSRNITPGKLREILRRFLSGELEVAKNGGRVAVKSWEYTDEKLRDRLESIKRKERGMFEQVQLV